MINQNRICCSYDGEKLFSFPGKEGVYIEDLPNYPGTYIKLSDSLVQSLVVSHLAAGYKAHHAQMPDCQDAHDEAIRNAERERIADLLWKGGGNCHFGNILVRRVRVRHPHARAVRFLLRYLARSDAGRGRCLRRQQKGAEKMTNFSVYDDVKTGTLVFAGTCPVTHKPWKVFGVKHADYAAWVGGKKIQDVMPYLSADDRELLISGTSKEGWDILFKEEDCGGDVELDPLDDPDLLDLDERIHDEP